MSKLRAYWDSRSLFGKIAMAIALPIFAIVAGAEHLIARMTGATYNEPTSVASLIILIEVYPYQSKCNNNICDIPHRPAKRDFNKRLKQQCQCAKSYRQWFNLLYPIVIRKKRK